MGRSWPFINRPRMTPNFLENLPQLTARPLYKVLSASVLVAGLASAEELPVIQLPEYIISGVEKATQPGGDRIATQASARIQIVSDGDTARPAFPAATVWTPPCGPALRNSPGPGGWSAEVGAGGFGLGEAAVSAAWRRDLWTLRAGGDLVSPPRRAEAGTVVKAETWVDAVSRLGVNGLISSTMSLNRQEFRLHEGSAFRNRSLTDAEFSLATTPQPVGWGDLAGLFDFNHWKLNELRDITGSVPTLQLVHAAAGRGRVESKLFAGGELTSVEPAKLRLVSLNIRYRYPVGAKSVLWGGTLLFHGSDTDRSRRRGAYPEVGWQWRWKPSAETWVQYAPQTVMITGLEHLKTYPMVEDTLLGAVREDIGAAVAGARYYFHRGYAEVKVERHNFRHQPFVVPDSAWPADGTARLRQVNRRTRIWAIDASAGYALADGSGIGAFVTWQRAQTSNQDDPSAPEPLRGDRAPGMPEWQAGVKTAVTKWKFLAESDLLWTDRTPIDFNGDPARGGRMRPARIVWNVSLGRSIHGGWSVRGRVDNLLNQRYYDFPAYEEPLSTVSVAVLWQGTWTSRERRQPRRAVGER